MPLAKATLPREGLLCGRAVPDRAIQTPKARLEQGEVPAALRAASGAALLLVLKTPINATNGQVCTRRWHREPRSEDRPVMQKCCITGQE